MASRILLADDHELIRRGTRVLLEAHPGWCICGEAAGGREAVQKARELKPDLVILDLTMPDMNGLEAARRILRDNPETSILIFTMHPPAQFAAAAQQVGVRGYVTKAESGGRLIDAVGALLRNRTYFPTPKIPTRQTS